MNWLPAFSAFCFFLFPFVIGSGILAVIKRFWRTHYSAVTAFMLGGLVMYALALIEQYLILPLAPQFQFQLVFFPSVYGTMIISVLLLIASSFPNRLPRGRKIDWIALLKALFPVGLSFFIAITAYVIWLYRSPYSLNWDQYEHQTLVSLIQAGHFSFFTSQISDTFIFNGYSSILHTMLAVAQFPFALQPSEILSFWGWLGFFQCVLVTYAGFLLAKALTKNTHIAILSSLLSGLVFESVIVFTSLFFIPQTFTAVIFALCLAELIQKTSEKKSLPPLIGILMIVFLLLNHYVMGGLATGIFVSSYVFLHYPGFVKKALSLFPAIEIGGVLILFLLAYSYHANLSFINHGEAAAYTFTLQDKIGDAQRAYGYLLFLFFPLGVLYTIYSRRKRTETFLLLWTLAILAGIMSQFPYVLKFYVIGRFFVHIFIALGIWSVLRYIRIDFLKTVSYAVLYVFLCVVLVTNAFYWKHSLNYQNIFTHVSPGEIEAATFLSDHYKNQSVLMISDTATQYILEALSGVNSPGGAYASPATRASLEKVNQDITPQEIATDLYTINDPVTPTQGKRLLVLSGRYFVWQTRSSQEKNSLDFNVWVPSDLSFANIQYISHLEEGSRYFKKVFQNQTLAIFEVNSP